MSIRPEIVLDTDHEPNRPRCRTMFPNQSRRAPKISHPGRKSAIRAGFQPDSNRGPPGPDFVRNSNRASETTRSTFKIEDPSRGRTDWPILMFSQIESDRNPTRKSDFRPGVHHCVTFQKRRLENRFKNRLKAKCSRRRGESTVLFKDEHAAQARARWHVRGGRAWLRRPG